MRSTQVDEMVSLPDGIKRTTSSATREQMVDFFTGSDTSSANPPVIKNHFTSSARSLADSFTLGTTQAHA